jgi:hypothetical protein
MTAGFDVSHFQTRAQVAAAAASGAFVIVKTSDGMGNDNPNDPTHPAHDWQVAIVRAAGKVVGHYHFARIYSQVTQEAAHFLALSGWQPGDILALDLENMNGTWSQRVGYAVAFLAYVDGVTGGPTWRYMNKDWLKNFAAVASAAQKVALARSPLWIATVGDSAGNPVGVSNWSAHQYSTSTNIDHNVLAAAVPLDSIRTTPGGDMPPTVEEMRLQAYYNWAAGPVGSTTPYSVTAIAGALKAAGLTVDQAAISKAVFDAITANPPKVDDEAIAAAVLADLKLHPLAPT